VIKYLWLLGHMGFDKLSLNGVDRENNPTISTTLPVPFDKLSLNGVDREPSPAPQNFYQQTHPHGSCSEGNFPEASAQNVG
jgi:hypothetical protein